MTDTRRFMLDRPIGNALRPRRRDTGQMADLDPWAPSDPLASVLHLLRMNGAFYCRSELTERWGMTLPAMRDYMWFHVVTSGRAQLETEGAEARWLQAGDFSLVPHGTGHVLRSDPGVPAPEILELPREELSERYEILRHGEGGAPTTLICGAVRFEHPAGRTLVEALPASIRIAAADSPPRVWMESTMALMAAEARALRPGGEAVTGDPDLARAGRRRRDRMAGGAA